MKNKLVTPDFIRSIGERTFWGEIKYYCFYRWWNYLDMLWRRIYWFFQRGLRGFADCDTWSLDTYLATMIPQALRHFKKYYHGAEPKNKELDLIIKGFEENLKIINLDYKYKSKKYLLAEANFKKGMKTLTKFFNYLWD